MGAEILHGPKAHYAFACTLNFASGRAIGDIVLGSAGFLPGAVGTITKDHSDSRASEDIPLWRNARSIGSTPIHRAMK